MGAVAGQIGPARATPKSRKSVCAHGGRKARACYGQRLATVTAVDYPCLLTSPFAPTGTRICFVLTRHSSRQGNCGT
jgi:hypothetical protein